MKVQQLRRWPKEAKNTKLELNLYRDQGDVGASEEETKCTKQSRGSKSQDDPYKVFEHLQLSLEEVCTFSQILAHTTKSMTELRERILQL